MLEDSVPAPQPGPQRTENKQAEWGTHCWHSAGRGKPHSDLSVKLLLLHCPATDVLHEHSFVSPAGHCSYKHTNALCKPSQEDTDWALLSIALSLNSSLPTQKAKRCCSREAAPCSCLLQLLQSQPKAEPTPLDSLSEGLLLFCSGQ